VRAAYGVSWAYLVGDVAHEGYKAYCKNQEILHPELPREAMHDRYNDAKTDLKTVATDSGVSLKPRHVTPLEDYRTVMAQRAVFQSIASMGRHLNTPPRWDRKILIARISGGFIADITTGLPAFTIHSIVRYSGKYLKNAKNVKIRTWGPIGLGLAAVPALPFLFDKPVEEAVEFVFHKGYETFGGKAAVGNAPATGREDILERHQQKSKKEKEL
jgi:fission process protein 1